MKNDYSSFVYTGRTSKCITNTAGPVISLIYKMVKKHGRIGVINLHERAKKHSDYRKLGSLFELGSLKGKSLHKRIRCDFERIMRGKHIIFDRDVHFTGGKETQIFHQIFNDYGYDSGRKSRDFDIENNELQIAQLEL